MYGQVNRELDVFFAAHSWLNHQDERKKYAGDVMACVRFEHISPKDLMLHVEPSCKFFMELEGLEVLLQVYRCVRMCAIVYACVRVCVC